MSSIANCNRWFLCGLIAGLVGLLVISGPVPVLNAATWGGTLSGMGPLANPETESSAPESEILADAPVEESISRENSSDAIATDENDESREPSVASVASSASVPAVEEKEQKPSPAAERRGPVFSIRKFVVLGNSLYPEEILDEVLKEFVDPDQSADEVEQARALLESFYRETGYVRVLVNVPEQEVENGIIKLQVTESRIGDVMVTGNRYFTRKMILDALPALRSGKIIYVPDVEQQLKALNKTPDLAVKLSLQPGRDLGVDDVVLKVADQLPLHGRMEVSNRASHNTSALRLNGMLRYDNLWQKGYSLSLQYQTAPLKSEEVQVFGASYVMRSPWSEKHLLALYSLWTDSDTAFGDEFSVTGKGFIAGCRYLVPLTPLEKYYHSVSFGLDYKDFDETIGFAGEDAGRSEAPISYLPFSVEYQGTYLDPFGATRFKGGLNWAFRDVVGTQDEFDNKRLYARGDYLYLKLGLKRDQKIPWAMELGLAIDSQIASEPLISSEQFSAGGMESVRGYKESDSLGDSGIRASLEWRMPDLGQLAGAKKWRMTPYLFHDFAWLQVLKPQAEQTAEFRLNGSGLGIRGSLWQDFDYQADLAWTSSSTDRTENGVGRCHFLVKYQF